MPDIPVKMRDMDMNEIWRESHGLEIMRVPGGWIYLLWDPDGTGTTSVFVPEPKGKVKHEMLGM